MSRVGTSDFFYFKYMYNAAQLYSIYWLGRINLSDLSISFADNEVVT